MHNATPVTGCGSFGALHGMDAPAAHLLRLFHFRALPSGLSVEQAGKDLVSPT
jgi:hypothetical protein